MGRPMHAAARRAEQVSTIEVGVVASKTTVKKTPILLATSISVSDTVSDTNSFTILPDTAQDVVSVVAPSPGARAVPLPSSPPPIIM